MDIKKQNPQYALYRWTFHGIGKHKVRVKSASNQPVNEALNVSAKT